MALDRIRPLKIESPDSGGTQEDAFPTDADHNEDYIDMRGIVFQDDSSDDELVGCSRDTSGNLIFWDDVTGQRTLAQVLEGDDDDQVRNIIAESTSFTVKENNQHQVFQNLTIDGEYIVEGQSVIFT